VRVDFCRRDGHGSRLLALSTVWTLALGPLSALAGPLQLNIPIRRVTPPEHILEGVDTVGLGAFSGPGAETLVTEIRAALEDPQRTAANTRLLANEVAQTSTAVASDMASRSVGGGIQGRIVRGITSNVSSGIQHGLDVTPLQIDDGLAIDVIRLVTDAPDAVLSGELVVTEELTESTQKTAVKDDRGELVKDEAGRTRYAELPCQQRKVVLTLTWTLTQADRTLVGKTFERREGDSRCGEATAQLATTEALVDRLIPGLGTRVVQSFAPSWKVMRLPLSRNRTLKPENRWVREGDYHRALCGLAWLVTQEPDHVGAHLNLGTIAEAMGYYPLASEHYGVAASLRDDPATARATKRMERRRAEVAAMVAAYGSTWAIPEQPDLSSCPAIPEGRELVLKKDATLRSESDKGEPLGRLNKGTELTLLEQSRDAVRVVAPDGRKGWLDAKHLK